MVGTLHFVTLDGQRATLTVNGDTIFVMVEPWGETLKVPESRRVGVLKGLFDATETAVRMVKDLRHKE